MIADLPGRNAQATGLMHPPTLVVDGDYNVH